jgi:hypothetical protein
MRVDVHSHYYHSTYVDRLARNGADTRPATRAPGAAATFDQRVELLDGAGIRVQVLSVGVGEARLQSTGRETPHSRPHCPGTAWAGRSVAR